MQIMNLKEPELQEVEVFPQLLNGSEQQSEDLSTLGLKQLWASALSVLQNNQYRAMSAEQYCRRLPVSKCLNGHPLHVPVNRLFGLQVLGIPF